MVLAAVILLAIVLIYLLMPKAKSEASSFDPERYKDLLQQNVAFYQKLDHSEQDLFLKKVINFLSKVKIEGVGTEVEDLDRVLIASSAIIPIFHFGDWEYRNITSVILYPDTFNEEFQFEGTERSVLGMVGNGFMNGQMILSKNSLRGGFRSPADGKNTAIHEFVHLLDKSDGEVDGIPDLLLQHSYSIPWVQAMHKEIRRIEKGKSDIDPYAITNEAEFFAVAAEYFFEKP